MRSVARKIKNRSMTTTSVIFSAKFNPRGPNGSEIINKHRHLLETDNTLKQLFPKNSVIVANKRGQMQELLTRADPYNIKSDSLNLNDHVCLFHFRYTHVITSRKFRLNKCGD